MDDAKREKYLQKTYNISLAEFQSMADDGCMGCGAFGKTRSLHVDHDHALARKKIKAYWDGGGWWAMCDELPWLKSSWSSKKYDAIRVLKQRIKRLSVRGVLCFSCNSALKKLRDSADIAEKLARYLRHYETILSQEKTT